MATNLVFNFIGNNKLSKTTSAMSQDIKKMGDVSEKVGKKLNQALGMVGLGLGIHQLTGLLKDSAKAAIEDNKSQALLAQSLKNSIGATKDAVSAAEQWIKKTQLAVSVADDELRPALATAVGVTGNLADGQKLLSVALDVSAGKQLDLKSVTNALAKAQGGNYKSLQKLLPGMKLGADFMSRLEQRYKGMAKISASQDPFKRMDLVMNDLKETIGNAILPYLQKFADYLASPTGQNALKRMVDGFIQIAKFAGQLLNFLVQNIDIILRMLKLLIEIRVAMWLNVAAMKVFNWWTNRAKLSMVQLGAAVKKTGIGLLVVGVAELAVGFQNAQEKGQSFVDWAKSNLQESGTGIVDFARWLFGQETLSDRLKRISDADQNRWIAMGKHFGTSIANGVNAGMNKSKFVLNKTGDAFRKTIGLALGVAGQDEFSVFNMDKVMAKAKRMVDAAKGFATNIKKLVKAGAGVDVINELIAMGPAQGNIVAKGLLGSGQLSEYLGLRQSLYQTGVAVNNVPAPASYTFNIKSDMSAQDIVTLIQQYEKKTKKKYFVN